MKKVNQEPTALGGSTFAAVVKECLQARALNEAIQTKPGLANSLNA